MSKSLDETIIKAVYEWALQQPLGKGASWWPLSITIGQNEPDDWWDTDGPKMRKGPVATVHHQSNWAATVFSTRTGKKPTVYVPEGAEVIYVKEGTDYRYVKEGTDYRRPIRRRGVK
jgi:hypothetical protein